GLLVIVLVGLIAREFDLIAIKWIVDSLKTVWLIAFVILFQPELRHALAQFGRTRYFRSFLRGDHYGVLGEIVRGAEQLAQRRHGGLIVVERNVGLRNFVETGTRIDAKVSAELLVTLFSPGSPLHDGAVILREDAVVAAASRSQRPPDSPRAAAYAPPTQIVGRRDSIEDRTGTGLEAARADAEVHSPGSNHPRALAASRPGRHRPSRSRNPPLRGAVPLV